MIDQVWWVDYFYGVLLQYGIKPFFLSENIILRHSTLSWLTCNTNNQSWCLIFTTCPTSVYHLLAQAYICFCQNGRRQPWWTSCFYTIILPCTAHMEWSAVTLDHHCNTSEHIDRWSQCRWCQSHCNMTDGMMTCDCQWLLTTDDCKWLTTADEDKLVITSDGQWWLMTESEDWWQWMVTDGCRLCCCWLTTADGQWCHSLISGNWWQLVMVHAGAGGRGTWQLEVVVTSE